MRQVRRAVRRHHQRRRGRSRQRRRPVLPRLRPPRSHREGRRPRRRGRPSVAAATVKAVEARTESAKAPAAGSEPMPDVQPVAPEMLKDAFLAEVRKGKKFFYGTVVAQAQRIDVDGDRIVFTFAPQHRALRVQLDQSRAWLDALASQLSNRKMTVVSAEGAAATDKAAPPRRRRRRRRTASRSCGSRRSPIRACRRCSTSSPPRSRMSRRCERLFDRL